MTSCGLDSQAVKVFACLLQLTVAVILVPGLAVGVPSSLDLPRPALMFAVSEATSLSAA